MKKKIDKKLYFIMLICIFTSCASKPNVSGKGDLCGFVIDENNLPVSDFVISASRNKGLWNHTITNSEGMFVFPDSGFGNYSFKGSKSYFMKLKEVNYAFYDKGKIYCFQINSIDKALDEVEKMILCEDFERAEEILNQISVRKKSQGEILISFYKEYIRNAKNDMKTEKEKIKNEKL